MHARAQLGMRPDQPGPLTNVAVRQDLLLRYSSVIADGIANLEKALEIDPQCDDAMAYMNLLIRERGDLRDTPEESQRDIELADQWVEKALAPKTSKASAAASRYAVPPPPPPPAGVQQAPQRIRVGSPIVNNNFVRKVQPVYPQDS